MYEYFIRWETPPLPISDEKAETPVSRENFTGIQHTAYGVMSQVQICQANYSINPFSVRKLGDLCSWAEVE